MPRSESPRGLHAPPDESEPARFIAGFRANSLEGARSFLEALPRDGNIGYVLFVAADPSVEDSHAASWLATHSPLPLVEAANGMAVSADRIHLAPDFGQLIIRNGRLHFQGQEPASEDVGFDIFLQALAISEGPRAVAFVRDGHEGAMGPRMIREAGGLLIAEARMLRQLSAAHGGQSLFPEDARSAAVPLQLRLGAGVDTAGSSPDPPAAAGDAHPRMPAARAVAGGFFRDAASLFDLQECVRLSVATEQPEQRREEFRVWVLGCGTGEEAYTVAMLAAEALESSAVPLRVFAADLDATAIERARHGVYGREVMLDVPAEYLQRYFIEDRTSWRITPRLRDSAVFSRYTPTDPPLSRMDVIVCRRLLSSLPREEWAPLVAKFRFALNPGGLLLLGPGDEVPELDGFQAVPMSPHLYVRGIAPAETSASLASPGSIPTVRPRAAEPLTLENQALQLEIQALRQEAATEQRQSSLRLEDAVGLEEELTRLIRVSDTTETGLQDQLRLARGAEGELWNIVASSPFAVLLLDISLNIRFFTPSKRLPFRMMPRDVGRPVADIASLVDDPELMQAARFVIATGESASREVELPDGTWLMRRIHPYLQGSPDPAEGRLAGVIISYADIRETKAAAARAEAMRSIAGDLVRAHYQPLVVLDANLHVIFSNHAFRETFGGKADETALPALLGAAIRATPQLAAFLTSRDDRGERIDNCVIQITLPATGLRTLRIVISHLPPRRTMLAIEDITERAVVMASLENAKSAAERASYDKSRMLAAAGRDLRRRQEAVALAHRQLTGLEPGVELAAKMERLGSTINEIGGMLDTLQDRAQLDMGVLEVDLSTFPVNVVLDGLHADFDRDFQLHGLEWRVVRSGQMIVSDPRILRRALRHLILDLLRATRLERILIGCRRRGGLLRMELWARGVRIPLPLLRTSFERRPHGMAREGGETLGLGLDMARKLSERLGHPFRVEASSPGQPVFILDLPTAAPLARTSLPADLADDMRHVLIIVGDTELAGTLRLLLERDGYASLIATDAGHGVGLALELPPALVITEFELAGAMTGLDLARRIAGIRPSPPATILLTDDVDASVLQEIAASNFEQAPRTIDAEELLERVHRLLPHPMDPVETPGATPLGQIFVVDGDTERRSLLLDWLENQGWSAEGFASGEAFLHADTPERRGCVVADWPTAETGAHPLLPVLRSLAHRLPTVVIADGGDIQLAVRVISAGAVDFINRSADSRALAQSIRKASAQIAVGAQEHATRTHDSERLTSLTQRQREILDRVLAGTPNKIIAADLNLSQRTVENHRATMMAKLGARSLTELVRIVMGAR